MTDELHIPGTRPEGCSAQAIAKLHAGDLAADEARSIEAHVQGCERCQARLAALEHQRRVAKPLRIRSPRRAWAPMAAGLALAAVVAIFVRPEADPELTNRRKGAGELVVYVGTDAGASRIAREGEQLLAGERVRLAVGSAHRYVAVISIDDTGEVTPLHPESGASERLEKTETTLIPGGFELTGAGLERLVAVFSDAPIEVDAIVKSARTEWSRAGSVERMQALPLPADEVATILRKP